MGLCMPHVGVKVSLMFHDKHHISLLITCLYFTSNRLQEILWRHALRQVQKEKAIKYIDPREGVEISKLFNILDALQIYRLLRYHKELAW